MSKQESARDGRDHMRRWMVAFVDERDAFLAVPLLVMGPVAISHMFSDDEPALPD